MSGFVQEFARGRPNLRLLPFHFFDQSCGLGQGRLIPRSLTLQANALYPLRIEGGRLDVAMAVPQDAFVVKALGLATGLSIRPHLALESDIEKALAEPVEEARVVEPAVADIGLGADREGGDRGPLDHGVRVALEQRAVAGRGRVRAVAVGDDESIKLKVGDQVLFAKYSGAEFKLDGVEYLLMECSDILARLRE